MKRGYHMLTVILFGTTTRCCINRQYLTIHVLPIRVSNTTNLIIQEIPSKRIFIMKEETVRTLILPFYQRSKNVTPYLSRAMLCWASTVNHQNTIEWIAFLLQPFDQSDPFPASDDRRIENLRNQHRQQRKLWNLVYHTLLLHKYTRSKSS